MGRESSLPLDDIINRLLEFQHARTVRQVQLSEAEFRSLCNASREIFLYQPNLLELEARIKICVIERAYKKLALDALVIEQGRLPEQKTVNKDELLQMVRFGAEMVFSSKDTLLQMKI